MSLVATPHEGPSTGEPAPAFRQKLGLFDATMLVAGTMIGSGIFLTSADIARDVGATGWLLAVWVLSGVMTMMGALCYAELAAMMPNAGGQYVYLRESFSPLWGFLYGWTCFLVIQTGSIAAVAVAFAKFLGVLVPSLGTGNILWEVEGPYGVFEVSAGQLVGMGIVLLLTFFNCRGIQEGKWLQNIFTVAKTLALILLIVLGLTLAIDYDAVNRNFGNLWGGITSTGKFQEVTKTVTSVLPLGAGVIALMVMGGAMVGALFSSDAWNNVTFTAGEVKNPRRTLPASLALGTGMVVVLYLLANLAYLADLPLHGNKEAAKAFEQKAQSEWKEAAELRKEGQIVSARAFEADAVAASIESAKAGGIDHALDDRVATAALRRASPRFGVTFMAVAIMVSTFGCINGMILMGARLYYAMARDNLFFASVGRLNRRGVPGAGLVLQGVWSVLLVFSGTYSQLLDYVIFAALLFYVLTVVGLFLLRRARPEAERPYRVLGYPWIPALYVFLCTAVMLDLLVVKPEYTWPGLIIVVTGIPVYFFWRARNPGKSVPTTVA